MRTRAAVLGLSLLVVAGCAGGATDRGPSAAAPTASVSATTSPSASPDAVTTLTDSSIDKAGPSPSDAASVTPSAAPPSAPPTVDGAGQGRDTTFCTGVGVVWDGGDIAQIDVTSDPAGYAAALLRLDDQVQDLQPPPEIADAWAAFQAASADRAAGIATLDTSDPITFLAGLTSLYQKDADRFAAPTATIDAYIRQNCG